MKRLLFLLIIFVSLIVEADDYQRIKDDEILALPSKSSVVLINFWATWCEPCRVEIPALNKLHSQHPSVNFYGINMDDVENRGAIKGFLKKFPITYQIYLREGKEFETFAQRLSPDWKSGIPATFVYKDGKQVYAKLGQVSEEELEKVLSREAVN